MAILLDRSGLISLDFSSPAHQLSPGGRSMATRFFSVSVVVCAVMAAGIWINPGVAQQLTFRTGARVVPLYATAVDAQRRPVSDLTRDDFLIFDNEKPQGTAVFA